MAFRESDDDSQLGKKPSTSWFRVLDEWQCELKHEGKPCPYGPDRKGVCRQSSGCLPRRTTYGRIKQAQRTVIAVLAIGLISAVFLTSFVLDSSGRSSLVSRVMKPGNLSRAHAQILASVSDDDRCASCHEGGLTSWNSDEQGSVIDPHQSLDMTGRCMECHKTSIAEAEARHAHSMPRQSLVALTAERARIASSENGIVDSIMNSLARTSMDQSDIACSLCHVEHHGADFNISHMSNGRCQSCHVERYDSFSTDHPALGNWPHGDGSMSRHSIAFDHGSHAVKHYPATGQAAGKSLTFDCQACHVADSQGEINRQVVYEQCSSCHDKDLRIALSSGVELMTMPMIERSVANQIEGWPSWAVGIGGDPIPLLHRWLISTEVSKQALDNAARDGTSVEVAQATINLWRDLQSDGQNTLVERLTSRGFSQKQIESIAGQFSAQLSSGIQPKQTQDESHSTVEPLSKLGNKTKANNSSDSLLGGSISEPTESLLGPPGDTQATEADLFAFGGNAPSGDEEDLFAFGSEETQSTRAKVRRPSDLQALGGWFASPTSGSIRYRPVGHADQVLTAMIDSAVERGEVQRLPAAANACLECHVAASRGNGWNSKTLVNREPIGRSFTRFSHRPHRNIDHLADCVSCHKLNEERGPTFEGNEFANMRREDCAACHQSQLAGDACTICHRYHIDPIPVTSLQVIAKSLETSSRRE